MPNDQDLDQFPLPSESDDSSSSPLTDPVAPDISAPPTTEPETPPKTDTPETPVKQEIPPETKTETDTKTQPKPELKPASAPKSSSRTLFTVIFLLLTIAGISTAIFLYTQNNQLKEKVADLNTDIQKQEIAERSSVPSSDENITTEDQDVATSSTNFVVPTTPPSPTTSSSPLKTFSLFTPLFELATSKYPDAQLLLISANNLQQDKPVIKYYFRQEPDKVKYFYILNDTESDLGLFDEQVWVSPDNNIPSLNDRAKNNQLGADLDTILELSNSLCTEKHSDCNQATSIKAQFIDNNTTLWQITYQLPSSSSPIVYQINSQTQSIIFRSDN